MAACALLLALPTIAAAQPTLVRTIPTAGLQFDVDWANNDIYTADSTTLRRYDLAGGGLETSWSAPAGAIINDVAAGTGGVYVAAAGTRRLYAFNADGTSMLQTDVNTQNRIGDVRGLLVASSGAYLVGNPGTLLRIGLNPLGSSQLVGGWGINSHTLAGGWETCAVGDPPYCISNGYSGQEVGKVTGAVDLDIRENVENTGNFVLFVLERRPLAGGYDYRVSTISDEHVPGSFAPQGFTIGGGPSNAGSGAGQFSDPYGIALDVARGRIYIADQGNNRVAVYTFGGVFVQAFGWGVDTGANQLESCTLQSGCQAGLAAPQLNNPLRVQVDPSTGDIYVSHLGGISQFSYGESTGPDGPGGAPKAPKDVLLKAKPKKVEEKDETTLTASLLPCRGTQGEPIVFEKKAGDKWKRIGGRTADGNCGGKVTPKVKETTRYRALSAETNNFQAGTSQTVKVRVRD